MATKDRLKYRLFALIALLILPNTQLLAAMTTGAIPVQVLSDNQRFTMMRGGEPYYIKGAGVRTQHMERLAIAGGNSVRTWSAANAETVLDEAHRLGLTVTLGLWVQTEQSGFDYDDGEAIAQQLRRFTETVTKFKDHPALLMWGIGNEVNLGYSNSKVWDAIEEIAVMIDSLDGNHPTMTVLAGMPRDDIQLIKEKCTHIDILGINAYAALPKVPEKIREYGWDRPYVVTEWGPNGYWEVSTASWGAAYELSSTDKAAIYRDRYENVILDDSDRNLGSYVFFWGFKHEWTPTWFGLFMQDGVSTPVVDTMEYLWRGSWPENRAPQIGALQLDGLVAGDQGIQLDASNSYQANASVIDLEGDSLRLNWAIHREYVGAGAGGDLEKLVEKPALSSVNGEGVLRFTAPTQPGAYRLYLYAYDNNNHVATANIPFYVN